MTAPESPAAEFSSNEIGTIAEYRPISRLALASLIVGMMSLAALIHPLLWSVPLVVVVLAVLALRRIAASHGELRGAPAARTGLGLALFFASWAMTWYLIDSYMITNQAREYGESWLQLLSSGRVYEAHQLTLAPSQRAKPPMSLVDLYTKPRQPQRLESDAAGNVVPPSPNPREMMEQEIPTMYRQFIAESPMRELLAAGAGWKFDFVRTVSRTTVDRYLTYVAQEYRITYVDGGQPKDLEIVLTLQRECADRTANWYLPRVTKPGE
jgi:hypothetical protein